MTRRDGTTPSWPHFVMGGNDPCVPAALETYAEVAHDKGYDAAYTSSLCALAREFRGRDHSEADPDAPPHRTDLPLAIAMMRREIDVAEIARRLTRIATLAGDVAAGAAVLSGADAAALSEIIGLTQLP